MLQDQDAHHDLGGIRRAPALVRRLAGEQLIDEASQVDKVDVPGDELQRVTDLLDLAAADLVGEQVKLDGAAGGTWAHRAIVIAGSVDRVGWG